MTRKFKTIGITFLAVFALSAVAASAAQATPAFTSEAAETNLQSTATSTQVLRVTSSVAAKCEEITLNSPSKVVGKSATTAVVSPSYHNKGGAKCALEPLGEAEVVTTGCTYEFTAGTSNVGIACSGNPIEIKGPGCTVKVGSQKASGVSFATAGSDINLTANVSVSYTASGALCGLFGISSSGTATYTGTASVAGTNAAGGAPVAIGYDAT